MLADTKTSASFKPYSISQLLGLVDEAVQEPYNPTIVACSSFKLSNKETAEQIRSFFRNHDEIKNVDYDKNSGIIYIKNNRGRTTTLFLVCGGELAGKTLATGIAKGTLKVVEETKPLLVDELSLLSPASSDCSAGDIAASILDVTSKVGLSQLPDEWYGDSFSDESSDE